MKRVLSWFAVAVLATAGLLVSTGSVASAAPPAAGYYRIYNSRSLDCLDQSWSGGVERIQVYAFGCNDAATNQVWKVVRGIADTYTLRNAKSGKCLNQSYSGGIERVDIIAFPCSGEYNDDWVTTYTVNWGIAIVNVQSGKCLDQSYANGTAQITTLAFECKSHTAMTTTVTNQHWVLYGVPKPADAVI